ncbi:hypothetical protein B0J11DRAFT_292862 [Dendryphion nanum]|uniref:Uncharacterized protein n=1 Tax=Dendryphion nanum TaxID=256645 RepID=A0A9P9DVM2_9PLEO|nr:hypothetical protein B0J11DRAFT_292862 [Dendryphion nanum]
MLAWLPWCVFPGSPGIMPGAIAAISVNWCHNLYRQARPPWRHHATGHRHIRPLTGCDAPLVSLSPFSCADYHRPLQCPYASSSSPHLLLDGVRALFCSLPNHCT